MARPRKLDGGSEAERKKIKEDFESLCCIMCTEAEICAFFRVTDKTLSDWCKRTYGKGFSEVYKEKSEFGKISLRRAQLKLAQKYPVMAIWLGKQWLGQRDMPVEVEHTVSPVDEITAEIFRLQREQLEAEAAETEE